MNDLTPDKLNEINQLQSHIKLNELDNKAKTRNNITSVRFHR